MNEKVKYVVSISSKCNLRSKAILIGKYVQDKKW